MQYNLNANSQCSIYKNTNNYKNKRMQKQLTENANIKKYNKPQNK